MDRKMAEWRAKQEASAAASEAASGAGKSTKSNKTKK